MWIFPMHSGAVLSAVPLRVEGAEGNVARCQDYRRKKNFKHWGRTSNDSVY